MSERQDLSGVRHLLATPERVAALHDAAALDEASAGRAFDLLDAPPSPAAWMAMVRASTLVLGVGLVVSAVIYGIAWNWAEIGYLSKITGVGALVAFAGGAAAVAGSERLAGRVSAIAAFGLVGPLLGMVGMAYQTGADPWELFAAWVALGLPFIAASRSGIGWALLVLVGDVALVTWWDQTGGVDWAPGESLKRALSLAALHVSVAALLRVMGDRGWREGRGGVGPNILTALMWGGWAFVVAGRIMLRNHQTVMDLPAFAFTLVIVAYAIVRLRRHDAVDAAFGSIALIGWTACLLWRIIEPDDGAFFVALFIGLVSVAEAAGLAMLIRPYAREVE